MIDISKTLFDRRPAPDNPPAAYNIYHGPGEIESLDWTRPIAQVPAGAATGEIPLELCPGTRHALAAKAVSAAGVEQIAGPTVIVFEVDATGRIVYPMAAPCDVTTRLLSDGNVAVGFSYVPLPGQIAPRGFEILTDRGPGQMDADHPLACIIAVDPSREDYEILLTAPTWPARFAVRAVGV